MCMLLPEQNFATGVERVIRVNTGHAQSSCDGSVNSELPSIAICFEGFLCTKSLCCLLLSKAHPNLNKHLCEQCFGSAVLSSAEAGYWHQEQTCCYSELAIAASRGTLF